MSITVNPVIFLLIHCDIFLSKLSSNSNWNSYYITLVFDIWALDLLEYTSDTSVVNLLVKYVTKYRTTDISEFWNFEYLRRVYRYIPSKKWDSENISSTS